MYNFKILVQFQKNAFRSSINLGQLFLLDLWCISNNSFYSIRSKWGSLARGELHFRDPAKPGSLKFYINIIYNKLR
jgi:hypothetical protein